MEEGAEEDEYSDRFLGVYIVSCWGHVRVLLPILFGYTNKYLGFPKILEAQLCYKMRFFNEFGSLLYFWADSYMSKGVIIS